MNSYLLVFDDGNGDDVDLKAFVDSLDEGSKMLALDGHVCFLQAGLSVADISKRFANFAGSRLFFITDISQSDYSGRMPGLFWNDFMRASLKTAAE